MFIDPELGRVGLDETGAKRSGIARRLARLPIESVPSA
jgi:pyruvate/2-oxoglutarate dehydrogenase complex dihydrolipoamide dehydrogenase (E3) component